MGRWGRWIRHAARALPMAVEVLPVIVIQASGFGPLVTGVGGAALLEARPGTTRGPAIALAAITMPTDEERSLAIAAAAADCQ